MVKKSVSATMIDSFLNWPRQFEKRYVQGEKEPATGAMILGKAWHKAVEDNYRQKLTSGVDIPLSRVWEIFATTFDDALHTQEIIFKPGETADSTRAMGLAITAAYHQSVAPKVRPLYVEEPFTVSLGDDFPYELVGYWDLIDQDNLIIDHKAYARAPNGADVDKNVQLGVYALAYRLAKGRIEKGLRLDVVVKSKEPFVVMQYTQRTNQDCRWLLGVIERMVQVLESKNELHTGGIQ